MKSTCGDLPLARALKPLTPLALPCLFAVVPQREAARSALLKLEPAALAVVFSALARYARIALGGWERGSLEEDEALLSSPHSSPSPLASPSSSSSTSATSTGCLGQNQRTAIRFRRSQRSLAKELVEFYEDLETLSR